MCFLITADGFRPFLPHLDNPAENNYNCGGLKLRLIADQGTASLSALLLSLCEGSGQMVHNNSDSSPDHDGYSRVCCILFQRLSIVANEAVCCE